MSTSGATIGGLNFNNSSSSAANLPPRVPLSLAAAVPDAGKSSRYINILLLICQGQRPTWDNVQRTLASPV